MSTHTDSLANVYARSLFELSTDAGGNDKVLEISDELEQICEIARQQPKVALFFASPIIDKIRRGKALSAIFSNRISDLTLRFLLVLNAKGRLDQLESITAAFDKLVLDAFGRVEVDVFSPTALDAETLNTIKSQVTGMLDKEPVLHPYIDPTMLGGIKLRIGDQLFDGSVQTRLRRLSDSLRTQGSSTIRERFKTYLDENNNQ